MRTLILGLTVGICWLLLDKLTGIKLWTEPFAVGVTWFFMGIAVMCDSIGD